MNSKNKCINTTIFSVNFFKYFFCFGHNIFLIKRSMRFFKQLHINKNDHIIANLPIKNLEKN